MKHFFRTSVTILICVVSSISTAQIAYNGDPDRSFFIARDLVSQGQYDSARDTLQNILSQYPDYTDVENLLAKTYSWEKNYIQARANLNRITSRERTNKDAWLAAIRNEIYAENLNIAVGLANKALIFLPGDTDINAIRLELESKLHAIGEGRKIPAVTVGTGENDEFANQLTLYNYLDVFDVVYDPMVYSGMEFTRVTSAGKIIPKVNYAHRFQQHGVQAELDFYPRFSEKFYGYLNYGYSNSEIFANHKVAVELYANLPSALEASAGIRYFDFINSSATIYTGSFGWYKGDYYFSLRPYVTPTPSGRTGLSGTLTSRKYLRDKYNYLGALLSFGFTPELKQFRSGDILLAETLLFVESQQLMLEYQFTSKEQPHIYKANLGLTRQELVFESGSFFWAISAGIRYQVAF